MANFYKQQTDKYAARYTARGYNIINGKPISFYEENLPILKDTDVIRVFHGFRELDDLLSACENGLSGKSRVGRVYSYESDNNPTGLFVTTNPKIAKEFGSYVIEFNAKVDELEAPVWPGGTYTVQGQMAQYFGRNKSKREEARKIAREKAKQYGDPNITQSDRPELAFNLFVTRERQALFVGHLSPNRIVRVWLRDEIGELTNMTRAEVLKKYKTHKFVGGDDSKFAKNRLFSVNENFDPQVFVQRLNDKYAGRLNIGVAEVVRAYGHENAKVMADELRRILWPKQIPAAVLWLGREYRKSKKKTQANGWYDFCKMGSERSR